MRRRVEPGKRRCICLLQGIDEIPHAAPDGVGVTGQKIVVPAPFDGQKGFRTGSEIVEPSSEAEWCDPVRP